MGEVFAGRYELVDPIGRGGVGQVWRAWDRRRRRYVAAKVLQQRDAHALLRFVREQAMRIDHPYILAPTSWAADDEKVLFTMELVRGGSLAQLIGDYGALPPHLVCTLLDQLLAGLTAVHAEGVVHRDIKPANLLLEATGTGPPHLRLSDFGIAVRTSDPRLTETNFVVGTPGYFAPEQLLGAEPDFPQDLFAVGVVALYMLTGSKPDTEALVDSYSTGGFPAAPEAVPHALWQVVASLLNPNPQARFRTATGVRKALAAAREVLPDPSPDDEVVEVFDHLGPLPNGFGPDGPQSSTDGQALTAASSAVSGNLPAGQVETPGNGRAAPGAANDDTGDTYALAPPTPPGGPPLVHQPTTQATAGPEPYVLPQTDRLPGGFDAPEPAPAQPGGQPHSSAATGHTFPRTMTNTMGETTQGPNPAPRPGPTAKIVVPVLMVAALCFAVGIWALATG